MLPPRSRKYQLRVINHRSLGRKLGKAQTIYQTTLVVADNLLIANTEERTSQNGIIYALNRHESGLPEQWRFKVPREGVVHFPVWLPAKGWLLLAPTHVKGDVNALIALDINTGKECWKFPVKGWISTPVVTRGGIFFTVDSKKAFFLSLTNPPDILWCISFPHEWWPHYPVADENWLYVPARKGGVFAYCQADGKETLNYGLEDSEGSVYLPASVTEKQVFVGTSKGWVIAYDKITTKPLWKKQVGQKITTGPLAWKERIFVGCKSDAPNFQIMALAQIGNQELWSHPFTLGEQSHFHAPLTIHKEALLCGSDDGHLYMLDGVTGKQLSEPYPMRKQVQCQPVICTDGHICIANRNTDIAVLELHKKPSLHMETIDLIMNVRIKENKVYYALRFHNQVSEEKLPPHLIRSAFSVYWQKLKILLDRYASGLLEEDDHITPKLQEVGLELYYELFSKDLRQLYQEQIQGKVKTWLFIVDGEASLIPWEIIVPPPEDVHAEKPNYQFLCERFQIGRWIVNNDEGIPMPEQELRITPLAMLSDYLAIQEAVTVEAQKLKGMLGPACELMAARQNEIEKLFQSTNMNGFFGLHLSGHGRYQDDPLGSKFQLESGWLDESQLLRIENQRFGKVNPFVFLNFCESGQVGYSLFSTQGWVAKFLKIGASAVISTMWKANDETAANFAYHFYSSLLKGLMLGQAMHNARQAVKDSGDSTWLCYALYGNPLARVDITD